jgi:hypothetical protein
MQTIGKAFRRFTGNLHWAELLVYKYRIRIRILQSGVLVRVKCYVRTQCITACSEVKPLQSGHMSAPRCAINLNLRPRFRVVGHTLVLTLLWR